MFFCFFQNSSQLINRYHPPAVSFGNFSFNKSCNMHIYSAPLMISNCEAASTGDSLTLFNVIIVVVLTTTHLNPFNPARLTFWSSVFLFCD